MLKNKIDELIKNVRSSTFVTSTALQYLVFVFISFIFWAFISLNNNIQYDITMPFKITEIPDSSTIISDVPQSINVNVKDKGLNLLRFIIGKSPEIKVKFKDYALSDGMIEIPNLALRKSIRDGLENTTIIQNMSLEDIKLKYTNLPGKKVPIRADVNVHPNIQYTIYGDIKLDYDSAIVYSDRNTLAIIDEVHTYKVNERNLKDTLTRVVSISPIQGAKIIPEQVNLTIPIEPLISKSQEIPVVVKYVPSDINVITFPSKVIATFLVPFSMYKKSLPLEAVVNYNEIKSTSNNKLCVRIEESPAIYENISLVQDSVEYIIEKH